MGTDGTLLLPPPQETTNPRSIKHETRPILLKGLREAPTMRANIAASEYQSFKSGLHKEAAGRAVVLTARLKFTYSLKACKSSEASENVQLAPGGRLLQLKLTRPLKVVEAGTAAPERTMEYSAVCPAVMVCVLVPKTSMFRPKSV